MKLSFTEFFIKRPTIFWSFVAAILVAGVLSFAAMPKLEDPAVCGKQAMVIVPYPGATAHEVELKVALLMEDKLRELPNVRRVKTECRPSMAMFTVEFEMSVLMTELEQYFDFVRRKVSDVKSQLPQDCLDPIVIDDMMDVYGIFYSLTGEGFTYPELDKYAKFIRRELQKVKGVKRIIVSGAPRENIDIILSKDKLSRNGLIPTQIMLSLNNAGKTVNGGKFEGDFDTEYSMRISEAIENEEDIKNILISTSDGKTVRIGDIATVKRTFEEPQTNGFYVNNQPAVAICIAMEKSAIVPDVGKAVDKKLAEVMQKLPLGVKTDKIFFQPDKVETAISGFMINLVESVLIVIVVLIFAMGFRSGLIIGFGLVLTISLSFPILYAMGTTLQRISLGAFIVAMGMLVDNSIVIMDGILIDKQRGFGPKTYLFKIGKNTALPLLAATVIAISTFLGVYLSPDTAGEYCRDMFLVLCVSLLASWILALVQVPMCAKSWIEPRPKPNKKSKNFQDGFIQKLVSKTVTKLIENKVVTIICAVIILGLSGFGMTKVKNMFFPDFDYNQFVVEYWLPAQTSSNRVKKDLQEITDTLMKNPDIQKVSFCMGAAPAHYSLVRPMTNGGESYGELIIDCKDFNTIKKITPNLRKFLRENYPDAYIRLRRYNFSIATSHPVEAQFRGPDPEVLRSLSAQAEEIMRQCEYVDKYSVQNNWRPTGKSLTAEYIRENAIRCGIERSDMATALAAATSGSPIGVLTNQDNMVIVNLKIRNADGSKIQNLNEIPVWSTMNLHFSQNEIAQTIQTPKAASTLQDKIFACVPLSAIAKNVRPEWEEQFIYRVNGERAIEAECDPDFDLYDATQAKVMQEIKEKIEQISLPEGYSLVWVGEGDTADEAMQNIIGTVPVILLLILGILLLLFNSWRKVILVIMCFPFVICGIVPALLLMKIPFTFVAIIGLMGLMGMMVKNSIVLVDEIGRLKNDEKMSDFNAVVTAAVSRTRPVVMASLTTILGMIPLISDAMYNSMAIAIMFGLAVGTIITLVLLPVFYSALFGVKK